MFTEYYQGINKFVAQYLHASQIYRKEKMYQID